ncbi:hypothetical protein O181_042104 [Austropuccinia psidii MF-1]|uniref:Uncharacterized protein n=1 Tax=Austropuccinia psidii MF-1 TaxID=1389203 RepID=A0A9Q3HH54_9BASI|nr:hypothetical protein [Austropuccinia psidii MF-1]
MLRLGAKIGSGGPTCGLGPTWPLLSSLDLGQKGAYGSHVLQAMDYGPKTIEALGGLNGPKRPFRPKDPIIKGVGPRARGPWKAERTPRPKTKGIGLGVGEMDNWPKRTMRARYHMRP